MTNSSKNVKCKRCGGLTRLVNEFGIRQCPVCGWVYDPHSKGRRHRGRTFETERIESLAEFYGRSPERYRDRVKAGQMSGTLIMPGTLILHGSIDCTRKKCLPRISSIGSIVGVKPIGSVFISRTSINPKLPWVELVPGHQGYVPYQLQVMLSQKDLLNTWMSYLDDG